MTAVWLLALAATPAEPSPASSFLPDDISAVVRVDVPVVLQSQPVNKLCGGKRPTDWFRNLVVRAE